MSSNPGSKFISIFREKKMYLLFSIIIIGLILRLINLDFQSFWYEELMTLNYAKGKDVFDFFRRYYQTSDASPPLYSLFVYFIRSLNLNSDWLFRFPSVVFGTGTVVMSFFLGKRLSGEKAGLMAAMFAAVSGALVYYSQTLRYNSALVFFILTFTYLYLDYNNHKNGQIKNGLLIGNIIILTLLHYLGILFILELVFLSILINIKNSKFKIEMIDTLILMGLIFTPWLRIFSKQLNFWSINKPINSAPSLWKYFSSMMDFSFFYQTYWEKSGTAEGSTFFYIKFFFYLFMFVCLVLYVLKTWKEKNIKIKNISLAHIVLWAIPGINISLFLLLDLIGSKKYFYEKNLLFILPFLYIAFAHILTKTFKNKECIVIGIFSGTLFIYRPFILDDYYGKIAQTEFKQTTELIAKDTRRRTILVMCGDERWYDYYFTKYKISNVKFIKNNNDFTSTLKKEKEAWVMYAHCFPDLLAEIELSKHQVLRSYSANSLAFAKLYKFNSRSTASEK